MAARPRGSGPRRPPKPQPNPWLVGLALALVLATIGVVAFGLMHGGGGTAAAGTTTTLPTAKPRQLADGATTTTLGDGTGARSLPGSAPAPPDRFDRGSDPLGDRNSVPTTSGPRLRRRWRQVWGAGRTFGQPTDDTGFIVGSGAFGECPGWSIRVVNWGPLVIVVRGEPGDNAFVSYRLDVRYGGVSSDTTDIATLSGLRVLDTVAELKATYSNYSVEFAVDQNVGLTFQLKLTPNDSVLLWGPVDSQADDALVTGIYSPDACDQTAATTTTAPGA
jgi:hypothetical protein